MLKTILVPVDGSPLAERAVPYAVKLAKAAGAKVALLRVLDTLRPGRRAASEPDPRVQLEATAERARAGGAEVETVTRQVYYGDTAAVIVQAAREERAGLIVMSTHGRGSLGRWLYGSVADAVLRTAEVPIALVPADCGRPWPAKRPLRLLVPLDGSDLAAAALGPAAELADGMGAELLLLSVVQPPTYAYAEGYAYLALDPEKERAAAARELQAAAEKLRTGSRIVKTRVELGFPVEAILEVAREADIDLVVMATHGRGGLARLVLGSVATGTLQRSGLPVLLVRPSGLARPAEEPANAPAVAAGPQRDSAALDVRLTAGELDLLERGLGALLYEPEADWHLAERARTLLARLQGAEQGLRAEAAEPLAAGRAGPTARSRRVVGYEPW